jgi:hypothetical protein
VRVVHHEWDQLEIARSLEQDALFSKSCWHINICFAFVRRIAGRSACVERWGGILKRLYSPQVGQTTTSLVQAARLDACGLRADGSDDAIIYHIAANLWDLTNHRNTNNRALLTFKARAVREAAGRLGAGLRMPDVTDARAAKITSKHARERVTASRLKWEPKSLDIMDKSLLETVGRRGALALPVLAQNHKQWMRERKMTDRDISRTQRAMNYSVTGGLKVKKPRELGDSSSSDAGSADTSNDSDSSSSAASGADGLSKPEGDDLLVPGRFHIEDSPLVASNSGAAAPSGAASSSAAPTTDVAQFQSLRDAFASLTWALPRGGKIHLRVDAAEMSYRLCNLNHALSPVGLQCGDTETSLRPYEESHDWCKGCLKHRGG